MSKVRPNLTDAEVGHLRRLLGWVRCEIGQSPEDLEATLRKITPAVAPEIGDEGRLRLKEMYDKSVNVPQYIRAAIKALEKTLVAQDGVILDVDSTRTVRELEGG